MIVGGQKLHGQPSARTQLQAPDEVGHAVFSTSTLTMTGVAVQLPVKFEVHVDCPLLHGYVVLRIVVLTITGVGEGVGVTTVCEQFQ